MDKIGGKIVRVVGDRATSKYFCIYMIYLGISYSEMENWSEKADASGWALSARSCWLSSWFDLIYALLDAKRAGKWLNIYEKHYRNILLARQAHECIYTAHIIRGYSTTPLAASVAAFYVLLICPPTLWEDGWWWWWGLGKASVCLKGATKTATHEKWVANGCGWARIAIANFRAKIKRFHPPAVREKFA